jgi:hypothetical protein
MEAGTRTIDRLQSAGELRRIIRQIVGEPGILPARPVERYGPATVADGDTIAHGLRVAPRFIQVFPTAPNRMVGGTVDQDEITVSLRDETGAAVTTPEDVFFRVIA